MVGLVWRLAREWAARLVAEPSRLRALRLDRAVVVPLAAGLAAVLVCRAFLELADDVADGDTRPFDEWAVRALRRADDRAVPVGPSWLREVGVDFTALGSVAVLVLFTAVVGGFLLLHGRRPLVWLLAAALAGGLALNSGLKYFYDRARPDVVPHLREVATPSFPSGHASLSAVVYLTLGVIAARVVQTATAKAYCVFAAFLLSALVGMSRVYLGVHYPTDVLAGWAIGLTWALACWAVSVVLARVGSRPGRRPRRRDDDSF